MRKRFNYRKCQIVVDVFGNIEDNSCYCVDRNVLELLLNLEIIEASMAQKIALQNHFDKSQQLAPIIVPFLQQTGPHHNNLSKI